MSSWMIREIREEPSIVRRIFGNELENLDLAVEKIRRSSFVITSGSGTSYNAALYLHLLLLKLGIPSTCVPASEVPAALPGFPQTVSPLLIAFSQSGGSIDVLNAASAARERGIPVLSVTNGRNSKLAGNSDASVTALSGEERSIPATKSHMAQLSVIASIYFALKKEEVSAYAETLASAIESALTLDDSINEIASASYGRIVLLGTGLLYVTALEGGLKIRETASVSAEAFHEREYLHGPMQILNSDTLMISLSENDSYLRNRFQPHCGRFLAVSHGQGSEIKVNHVDDVLNPMVHLIPLQLFSFYKAVHLGIDPDKPSKLRKVVEE